MFTRFSPPDSTRHGDGRSFVSSAPALANPFVIRRDEAFVYALMFMR